MANSILPKIQTSYEKDVYRDVFYMVVVAALAYTGFYGNADYMRVSLLGVY